MSDSVRPHRRQPTRLPRPWDSPGKNTGVGCHFLLQCMKVKSESEVAQLCPTLRDPMDCSPPGSSVHGIFQARVLEWGAPAFLLSSPSGNYFPPPTKMHLLTGHRHCRCPQTCLSKRSGISRKLSWSVIHKMTLGSSCGQCSYSGRRCAKEPTATPLL